MNFAPQNDSFAVNLCSPHSGVGLGVRVGRRLGAVLPISGQAFVMRNGYDAYSRRFFPVNDGERESVQDEPACSVLIERPASRPSGQIFKRIINLGEKSGARFVISLPIPSFGCFQFLPCLWMEAERLTCWHRTAVPPGGGVLPRTESSRLCQIRCPRFGV